MRFNPIKQLLLVSIVALSVTSVNAQATLDPNRERAIDSLALEKVRDLGKYIKIIGNKDTPFTEAKRVMDRAEELFAPDSEMGVSSLSSTQVSYYKVRQYFDRLMALNYEKVKIEWYDIHYISNLEPQPDGRYVGVITIYQRFEGYGKDGLTYKDTTKKDITIYVEKKKTQIAGRVIEFWDVILGDIRVTETSV